MRNKPVIFVGMLTFMSGILFAQESSWRVDFLEGMVYPTIATSSRTQGTVELRLEIASDGTVSRIISQSGPRMLAEAAQKNASKWRFKRSTIMGGQNTVNLTYIFRLTGDCEQVTCPTTLSFQYPDRVTIETKAPLWQP